MRHRACMRALPCMLTPVRVGVTDGAIGATSEAVGKWGYCSSRRGYSTYAAEAMSASPEKRRSPGVIGPLSATSRLMHRSKPHLYSITSSARASTDGGTARPRALAVLRLISSSNLVVCRTGKSAGLADLANGDAGLTSGFCEACSCPRLPSQKWQKQTARQLVLRPRRLGLKFGSPWSPARVGSQSHDSTPSTQKLEPRDPSSVIGHGFWRRRLSVIISRLIAILTAAVFAASNWSNRSCRPFDQSR